MPLELSSCRKAIRLRLVTPDTGEDTTSCSRDSRSGPNTYTVIFHRERCYDQHSTGQESDTRHKVPTAITVDSRGDTLIVYACPPSPMRLWRFYPARVKSSAAGTTLRPTAPAMVVRRCVTKIPMSASQLFAMHVVRSSRKCYPCLRSGINRYLCDRNGPLDFLASPRGFEPRLPP